MVILGIDSSDEYLSVGLSSGDDIILSRSSEPRAQNKNALHAFVSAILAEAGYDIGKLHGVAVSIGPGSFTGLRVGLAVAKGICWATGLPLAGVSALESIALCASNNSARILTVKDAKREEFYYAGFERGGIGLVRAIPDSVDGPDKILELILNGYAPVGPGIGALAKNSSAVRVEGEGYDRDRVGWAVAVLGVGLLRAGKSLDLGAAIPNYIRVPKPREWKP